MLTRIRIEVEGEDSAAACEATLDKYEDQLMAFEAERFDKSFYNCDWKDVNGLRDLLGREVTDEVIEFVSDHPGYRGRRVVQYRRIDTRSDALRGTVSTAATDSRVTIQHPPPSQPVAPAT